MQLSYMTYNSYRCPNITKQNKEKIHNAKNEVSKGDCIIMGDFNHGNIKWDTLQSTGVEDLSRERWVRLPIFAARQILCNIDRLRLLFYPILSLCFRNM